MYRTHAWQIGQDQAKASFEEVEAVRRVTSSVASQSMSKECARQLTHSRSSLHVSYRFLQEPGSLTMHQNQVYSSTLTALFPACLRIERLLELQSLVVDPTPSSDSLLGQLLSGQEDFLGMFNLSTVIRR